MDDANRVSKKRAIVIAALSFILMCLLAITLGVYWESNDDPAIARTLAQDAYYCIFVGKILSASVHSLYRSFPNCLFNWWLGFSVLSVSIGISSLVYVALQKYPKKLALFISSAIFMTGWFFGIAQMNFTRTSMAISTGGAALISYALRERKKGRKIALWLVGLFFMLLGREIRRDSGYIALGFLAVNGLIFLLQQKNIFSKEWFVKNWAAILLLIVSACAVFTGSAVDRLLTNETEQTAKVFQAARSGVRDYSSLYPEYETHAEEYEAYGFSENDWELFDRWIDGDPAFFTQERLAAVGTLKLKTDTIRGILDVLSSVFSTPTGSLLMLYFVVILLINPQKNGLPLLLSTLYMALIFALLIRMGRINARVSDSICWGAWGTTVLSSEYSVTKKVQTSFIRIICISCLTAWMLVSSFYVGLNSNLISPFTQERKIDQGQKILFDYVNSHKENIYLPTVVDSGIGVHELFVWKVMPSDYCSNYVGLGGWTSRLPSSKERWQKNGIENPIQALLHKDNTYLVFETVRTSSADLILTYFREHYSASAQMRTVDTVGNFSIVEYYIE